jgi:hypothetical protein
MLARTRADSRACEGRLTIRGRRITVEFDVYQAARYGAWLAAERHQSDEASAGCPGIRRGEADTRHTVR